MRAPRRFLWTTLAGVLWFGASPALALDDPATAVPPVESPPPPAAPTPEEMLGHAISLYQSGESRAARDEIQAVLAVGPALEPTVRQGALAWLGEILLAEQGPTAARNSFEALLVEAPEFRMDPFQHSPEACAAFDLVREEWRARNPSPPVDPPLPTARPRGRWPAVALAPGGYVYFERGRPLPGVLAGGAQLAGVTVSVVTGVRMLQMRDSVSEADLEAQARYGRLATWNRLSAALGWAAYATPVVVETIRWGARSPVSVRVGPGGLAVAGTF